MTVAEVPSRNTGDADHDSPSQPGVVQQPPFDWTATLLRASRRRSACTVVSPASNGR
jgi:hypothetical protein